MELVDRLVDELPIEKQKDIIATLATLRPSDRRVFVGTLLEHVPDEGIRLKAFNILESLFEAEPEDPAAAAAPLISAFTDDPTEGVDIVLLHGTFPEHRWRELPRLARDQRSALIAHFRRMTQAERKRVGRACGQLLPFSCVLRLLDEPPDHRCSMCAYKREHRRQFLLEQNASGEAPADRLLQPFAADLYTFCEDLVEDPAHPSLLTWLGLEESGARVCFDLGRSDARGFDVRIDTATICGPCRQEVYGFMAHHTNDREYHHLLGNRKLKQLEAKQKSEDARARWWHAERRRSVLHGAIQCLHGIAGKVRAREHRAARAAERAERERLRLEAIEEAKRARADLERETSGLLGKWEANDVRNTDAMLVKRTLYCKLQSEKEHRSDRKAPTTLWRRDEVANGGVSCKKREISDDGVPLTEAAAAYIFGTAPLIIADDSGAVARERHRAADYEARSAAQNEAFASHESMLTKAQFAADCESWRHDSLMVDDAREKLLNAEAILREERIRKREEEKARLKVLREELRVDGAARAADARRALRATREAKKHERAREKNERARMTLQEADQCAVDKFWGVFLKHERDRRLEEMRRLVWICRVNASHEVMRKTESIEPLFKDEIERRKPPLTNPREGLTEKAPS